jgi:hypothetical protein
MHQKILSINLSLPKHTNTYISPVNATPPMKHSQKINKKPAEVLSYTIRSIKKLFQGYKLTSLQVDSII